MSDSCQIKTKQKKESLSEFRRVVKSQISRRKENLGEGILCKEYSCFQDIIIANWSLP